MKNSIKRDNSEFRRSGTSNLTQAFDEAYALWDAVKVEADRPLLLPRIDALDATVSNLAAYRAPELKDMVRLSGGGRIALHLMPEVLRSIATEEGVRGRCWQLAEDVTYANGRETAIVDMMALAAGGSTSLLQDAARAWLWVECEIAVVG